MGFGGTGASGWRVPAVAAEFPKVVLVLVLLLLLVFVLMVEVLILDDSGMGIPCTKPRSCSFVVRKD